MASSWSVAMRRAAATSAVAVLVMTCWGQAAAAAAAAAAPAAGYKAVNLTDVLVSAGYFNTFLQLASGAQSNFTWELQEFIDPSSTSGLTLFAPTDDAWAPSIVKAYNKLSAGQKRQVLQYHAVPRFYDYSTLISKRRSSVNAPPTFSFNLANITIVNGAVVVYATAAGSRASVTSNYATSFPLTVFAINSVLLPSQIFGNNVSTILPPPPPPGAPSPAPAPAPGPADSPSDYSPPAPPTSSKSLSSNSTSSSPPSHPPPTSLLLLSTLSFSLLLLLLPLRLFFLSA